MKAMKQILILSLLFIMYGKLSAQISPICVSEKFSNQHTDNKEWNNLLDKACTEINQSKYVEALKTLNEAMRIDSLASKEDYLPNAYIDMIQRKIKRYLQDLKENGTEQKAEEVGKSNTVDSEIKVGNVSKVKEEVGEKKMETNSTVASKSENSQVNETKPENKGITEQAKEPNSTNSEAGGIKSQIIEPNNDALTKKTESAEIKTEVTAPAKNKVGELKFTDKDKEEFQEKGMQKVKQLETFVAQIGSKTTALPIKTQSIASAVKLFDNEEKTVQVSSVNNTEKPKYKIRSYLTKLMMLNYSDVKIEWAEFQYASDFIRGLDGNYYGYIIFQQRFNATSMDNQKAYSDITTKKIEVILKVYQKAVQGQITEQWDVFLGDISVVQTEGK